MGRATKKKPAPKSTHAVHEMRVSQVLEMLCRCYSRAQIVQYGAKEWSLCGRAVDKLIHAARESIDEINSKSRQRSLSMAVARAEAIYRRAWEQKNDSGHIDTRAALMASQELSKLQDVYPADRHRVSHVSDDLLNKTDEELEQIMNAPSAIGPEEGDGCGEADDGEERG